MVQSTHRLVIGEREVVKTYVDWGKDEPEREWRALTLLQKCLPGLAAHPLRRGMADGRPFVVMSRLPGEPLGDKPLTHAQTAALGTAMRCLYRSMPAALLASLPERTSGPGGMVERVRVWVAEPRGSLGPTVDGTLALASEWLASPEADQVAESCSEPVFTLGDGNLGNFLWDGSRCYIVDFEDSGSSDIAYEVADLVEHVSAWPGGLVTVGALTPYLRLTYHQTQRLVVCRRMFAIFWLLMLLPGSPGHLRNPAGTVERQAQRVVDLIG